MNYDELSNFDKTNPQHYRFVLGGRTANAIKKLKIVSLSKWHNPKTSTAYIIIYINDYYQLRSDEFNEDKYFLELPFNKRIPYTKEMEEYIIKESEKIDKEKNQK